MLATSFCALSGGSVVPMVACSTPSGACGAGRSPRAPVRPPGLQRALGGCAVDRRRSGRPEDDGEAGVVALVEMLLQDRQCLGRLGAGQVEPIGEQVAERVARTRRTVRRTRGTRSRPSSARPGTGGFDRRRPDLHAVRRYRRSSDLDHASIAPRAWSAIAGSTVTTMPHVAQRVAQLLERDHLHVPAHRPLGHGAEPLVRRLLARAGAGSRSRSRRRTRARPSCVAWPHHALGGEHLGAARRRSRRARRRTCTGWHSRTRGGSAGRPRDGRPAPRCTSSVRMPACTWHSPGQIFILRPVTRSR